jgi:4-diphosphocytidyl-2-C-methyl-D-erythritol kinase
MRLLAPAKINLHLRVASLGPDGFHPLLSWMTTIALFDTLTIEPRDAGGIDFTCNEPSLATDQNLVVRAAKLLWEMHGDRSPAPGTSIRLAKSIPSAAGLGGGSSDAATTLLALKALWKLDLSSDALADVAGRLGSDVPFFLHGPSSICQGRGEIVHPIAPPAAKFALLFFPSLGMSTADVYRTFDQRQLGKAGAVRDQPPWDEWVSLNADALLARLVNDLEDAAFAISPSLGQLRAELQHRLGKIVRMSGSGSTLFTLFDDERQARARVTDIQRQGLDVRAVAVAPRFSSPVVD